MLTHGKSSRHMWRLRSYPPCTCGRAPYPRRFGEVVLRGSANMRPQGNQPADRLTRFRRVHHLVTHRPPWPCEKDCCTFELARLDGITDLLSPTQTPVVGAHRQTPAVLTGRLYGRPIRSLPPPRCGVGGPALPLRGRVTRRASARIRLTIRLLRCRAQAVAAGLRPASSSSSRMDSAPSKWCCRFEASLATVFPHPPSNR